MTHPVDLAALRHSHEWLLAPIEAAVADVQQRPFFTWLEKAGGAAELAPVAKQIFHHSASLPRVIGLMLGCTPVRRGRLYQVYAEHAYEEADHHLLLIDWMMTHKLIMSADDAYASLPTRQTSACINIGYEIAARHDHDMWLATMNTAIELCFFRFFVVASRRTHELGIPHHYFDVHVEADEHHSVMGLSYLSDEARNREGELIAKALEGVALWSEMVHSWIEG